MATIKIKGPLSNRTLAKLNLLQDPYFHDTKPKKAKGETKSSLGKMTKKEIDELALEKLGVELDRRRTKEVMIEEFLKAQNKK